MKKISLLFILFKKLNIIILFLLMSLVSNLTYAVDINWAGEYREAVNVKNPEYSIGKPDMQAGAVQYQVGLESKITLLNFNQTVNYNSILFSSLLNTSEDKISKGNFIIFECNGTLGFSFESSTLLFDDGANSLSITHNINNPTTTSNIVAFGSITPSEYRSFFNIESDICRGEYVYLVLDINNKVNPFLPNFKVTIYGKTGDSLGTPEPDAMGVITTKNCISSTVEKSNTKILLGENDTFTLFDNAEVFGTKGNETLRIAGIPNATIDSNIERLEFPNNIIEYQFSLTGNILKISNTKGIVANIITSENPLKLTFEDGSIDFNLTALDNGIFSNGSLMINNDFKTSIIKTIINDKDTSNPNFINIGKLADTCS